MAKHFQEDVVAKTNNKFEFVITLTKSSNGRALVHLPKSFEPDHLNPHIKCTNKPKIKKNSNSTYFENQSGYKIMLDFI